MAAGDGATEFLDFENGGIGEGDGTKDVSDKIENEDQVSKVLGFSKLSRVQVVMSVMLPCALTEHLLFELGLQLKNFIIID